MHHREINKQYQFAVNNNAPLRMVNWITRSSKLDTFLIMASRRIMLSLLHHCWSGQAGFRICAERDRSE